MKNEQDEAFFPQHDVITLHKSITPEPTSFSSSVLQRKDAGMTYLLKCSRKHLGECRPSKTKKQQLKDKLNENETYAELLWTFLFGFFGILRITVGFVGLAMSRAASERQRTERVRSELQRESWAYRLCWRWWFVFGGFPEDSCDQTSSVLKERLTQRLRSSNCEHDSFFSTKWDKWGLKIEIFK